MSRVLTFSCVFPSYHPRKGEPTYFVEKILTSIKDENFLSVNHGYKPKHHTIRAGHRWKVGDKFSPRVWSGKPYQSKQIIIAPDIEVKKTWDFSKDKEGLFYLNKKWVDVTSSDIPQNDGLSSDDFLNWFPVDGKEMQGQIICWNDKIEYQ